MLGHQDAQAKQENTRAKSRHNEPFEITEAVLYSDVRFSVSEPYWTWRYREYKHHCVEGSASFLAEISLRSPRRLFIFIIQKYIFRIKVSKKICN